VIERYSDPNSIEKSSSRKTHCNPDLNILSLNSNLNQIILKIAHFLYLKKTFSIIEKHKNNNSKLKAGYISDNNTSIIILTPSKN
jgi:hypothetical protein